MSSCPVVRIKSTHPASQGDFVEINASDFDTAKGHELYVTPPPAPTVAVPPPPPAPVSPLANLPKDWRSGTTKELRATAERLGGRTPENREQAVAMIDAAFKK